MAQSVGTVAELWRFPVKSMAGERLEAAELTTGGIVGDRAYALIDVETRNVVSAKSVRLFPGILNCRARFAEPPKAGRPAPPVRIELPNGQAATSEGGEAEKALSALFGRAVRLASSAPEDFTIDEQVADVEGADPEGRRGQTLQQKVGAAFFAQAGVRSPVAATAFFDLFPLSVITRATLRRLQSLQPQSRFDVRRFRMNVVVETPDEGFVENDWLGQPLSIGAAAAARIAIPDPRCVMTTLPQDDLGQDTGILSALVEHNRMQVGEGRLYPCAGVYAVVTASGEIRVGDAVGLG
ncbi:MAG TPA: MOSC N-terminal beta barrel domain-containing protein [Caulobacteraceae bacterium]|nr:MOSC N-terminal beta barrel domain-containing protein [Caulobacteraceae bacterium]